MKTLKKQTESLEWSWNKCAQLKSHCPRTW